MVRFCTSARGGRGFSLLFALATLLLIAWGTANGQEDYRWKILGENGEEFVLTLFGTQPEFSLADGQLEGYNVQSFEFSYSIPFEIDPLPGIGSGIDYFLGEERTPGQKTPQIVVRPLSRPDLQFSFFGITADPTIANFDASLAPWTNRQWEILELETTSHHRYAGTIASVARLQVPEPRAFPGFLVGLSIVLRAFSTRDISGSSGITSWAAGNLPAMPLPPTS
ncbi:MAG: hypothetical protein R3E01_11665 [Pirellulaceae bacterium]